MKSASVISSVFLPDFQVMGRGLGTSPE